MYAIVGFSILFIVLTFFTYKLVCSYLKVQIEEKKVVTSGASDRRSKTSKKKGNEKKKKKIKLTLGGNVSEEQEKKIGFIFMMIVLVMGLLLRIMIAFVLSVKGYKGHVTDMNCFFAWADMVYNDGFKAFYTSDAFTDYPPGYMYILWLIGGIRHATEMEQSGTASVILTKMPAMLGDIGIAWFLYKLASEKFKERGAAILAALFLICPPILLDSTIWGQTDSVFMFFIVLMCYLIVKDKLIPSYFVYAIAILMKPQSLMFAPIVLLAYVNEILKNRKENLVTKKDTNAFLKRLGIHTGSGILAIGSIFLFMAPYGVSYALKQYTSTVTSYPYASVNAYNFWALIGKNWRSQDDIFMGLKCQTWGTAVIFLVVAVCVLINFRCKNSKSKYFFMGAFIAIAVFTLSVRMHERYMYPAVVFLLFAYAMRPRKELLVLFVTSVTSVFLNMGHALFYYDPQNFDFENPVFKVVGIMMLLNLGYTIYVMIKMYMKPEEELAEIDAYVEEKKAGFGSKAPKDNSRRVRPSEIPAKMTKVDYIAVSVITVIYAIVAFTNLGSHTAPETPYSVVTEGAITLDFGQDVHLKQIRDYLGYKNNPKYLIKASSDATNWVDIYTEENPFDAGAVFRWNINDVDIATRFLYICPASTTGEDSIIELAFSDQEGKLLTPINAEQYPALFDEQDTIIDRHTNLRGTYFDEIYHARTAYETIHGLYCYENTHPPLGKEIMALGIIMFGMNPFGWRFMGTLFGVLMVIIMYFFAKKFFKDTNYAIIATLLFSFDFMHFVQTRIATIDVFVVLFIMLSYYFMYLYTRMSFYDTDLKKTFIPLALCGVSMGLGIASKWTGIYSAAGLAVIIFIQFGRRFREYIYASQNPEGTTNGILHDDIIKKFPKYILKTVLFCVLVFIIVPAIIYCLAYIPFNDGVEGRTFFQKVIEAQKTMYNYHSGLDATHPYSSKWYQWPIMYRPMWYYSGVVSDTVREGISAFGNPLVWWAGIPASLVMLYFWIFKKERKCGFLILGYLAQYAPWFLVTRVVFIYHYFPSVPFITIMVAYCLKKITDATSATKKFKWAKYTKYAGYIYVAAAIVLFIMFYPVLTGTPVNFHYVEKWLKWFDKWVLIQTW
ncbi:MAG: glycosyltransferase family 39 protein [Lachnospiraceae bacterium]|nr:glycosyltransferase family 39 protein [Lachnospiraceae bacterium]